MTDSQQNRQYNNAQDDPGTRQDNSGNTSPSQNDDKKREVNPAFGKEGKNSCGSGSCSTGDEGGKSK